MASESILVCLLFVCLGVTYAQPAGKYYTGTSGSIGLSTCPIGICTAVTPACPTYQYRDGCVFNNTGICTNCALPVRATHEYYSNTAQQISSTCTLASCLNCPAGSRNSLCTAVSTGSCATCSPTVPTAGNYYVANTNAASNCVTNTCLNAPSPCTQIQSRNGCGGNTAGTCGDCPVLNANSYWTHALNAAACTQAVYLVPTIGKYYSTKGPSGMGAMIDCTAPASNKYFVTPTTSTTDCQTADKTICPAGKQNTGSSTTLPGVCTTDCSGQVNGTYWTTNTVWNLCESTPCADDCPIGQWRSGCAGTSIGLCAGCTTANASQVYATKGGWANLCQVKNCEKVCPTGQYITGCGLFGATDLTVGCGACNNAGVNDKFWVGQGAYLMDSCLTNICATCPSGNFRSGCGGLSAGTCSNCNNLT
jgi:hypothetical protein